MGTQNLSGSGTLTGDVFVFDDSTATLTSDVTIGDGSNAASLTINSGGTFDVSSNTLTLNRVDIFGFGTYSGTTGKIRTQGTSSIGFSGTFAASFEVNSGATTIVSFTTFSGSATILGGATLATGNQGVTLNGDLINSGTITKSSGTMSVGGDVTNNGAINFSGGNFDFARIGTQTLSGTGGIAADVRILSGSTVALGSNHQMKTLAVNSGGRLNTLTFTLSLNGAPTPLTCNSSTACVSVNITYNGAAAQTIQTSFVSYRRLGIDNAAGVTLATTESVTERLILFNGAF